MISVGFPETSTGFLGGCWPLDLCCYSLIEPKVIGKCARPPPSQLTSPEYM